MSYQNIDSERTLLTLFKEITDKIVNFVRELGIIKKIQIKILELKITVTRINSTDYTHLKRELMNRKISQKKIVILKHGKMKSTEDTITNIVDTLRYSKICIIRVPEGEHRQNETEIIFEGIVAEDFLKLMKNIKPHIEEVLKALSRINQKKTTVRQNRNW